LEEKKIKVIHQIPIFPLPNLVFFPKTFLPLHIFEPRYRRMIEDTTASENLIGMALLKEGWQQDYFGSPEVHDIACVGKIQQTEKLYDGKYNIMLYGMSRVRIIGFVQDRPYRIAKVKYLKDFTFDHDEFNETHETAAFLSLLQRYLREIGVENIDDLLKLKNQSFESVINQVASILDFTPLEKQKLLEEGRLGVRYEWLRKLLKEKLFAFGVARKIKYVPKDPSWN